MTTNTNSNSFTPPAPKVAEGEKTPAAIALGWLHTAKFLTTAPELRFLPPLDLPEIAFVGRSNAGKSTCINTLTQQKRLAFASKTPGRTQSINLFSLGKQGVTDAVLADLPGYGYAAVPKQDKLRWQQVMANYLVTRESLSGVVLRGLLTLVKVVLPLWIAEAQPLTGARKTVAEALLGAGAKGDLRKSLVQLTSTKKRR